MVFLPNALRNELFILLIISTFYFFLNNNSFCFVRDINHYKSIQLKNGNYLLVTESGIYIYDFTLRTKINHTEIKTGPTFYLDYQLKQIGNEENGYILLCTIDYFYIFSQKGELLQNSKVPLDTNSNDFYSIIPYDYDINNNYFYYAYHPISKSYNYFIKFNYNSISNNISFVKENHFVSVYEAYDNVSCHMIDYNSRNNIICLMLSEFFGSKTFYFKILDPDNNFDILLETQIRKDFIRRKVDRKR